MSERLKKIKDKYMDYEYDFALSSADIDWLIEQVEKAKDHKDALDNLESELESFAYTNENGEPKITTQELMELLMDFESLQQENERLKIENEKIRWSGMSWDQCLSEVKVLKSNQQVRKGAVKMDKEKLEKLWKMVEYVGEKKGLDFNEMIVFGSVFGQLEEEILRLQKENKELEKLYGGGILDIECLKDDAEEKQGYIDELEQSISFAKFQSDLQVKNILKLKAEIEK